MCFKWSCPPAAVETPVHERANRPLASDKEQENNLLLFVYSQDYISAVVEIKYNYWIGLVEREHEGHWSWVDGTDFSSTPT